MVVAEISLIAATPATAITLLMQRTRPPFDRVGLPSGAGMFWVRRHAMGRSLDHVVADGTGQEPRAHHLLQLWLVDRLEPLLPSRRRVMGTTKAPPKNPLSAVGIAEPNSRDAISIGRSPLHDEEQTIQAGSAPETSAGRSIAGPHTASGESFQAPS